MTIFPAIEGTKAVYTGQLVDETGAAVPASALTAAVLTFYDRITGTIVNGRSVQNVLNANEVAIDASGTITWTMQPADHPVLAVGGRSTGIAERHIAFFTFTWATGALEHNVAFDVAKQRVLGT